MLAKQITNLVCKMSGIAAMHDSIIDDREAKAHVHWLPYNSQPAR